VYSTIVSHLYHCCETWAWRCAVLYYLNLNYSDLHLNTNIQISTLFGWILIPVSVSTSLNEAPEWQKFPSIFWWFFHFFQLSLCYIQPNLTTFFCVVTFKFISIRPFVWWDLRPFATTGAILPLMRPLNPSRGVRGVICSGSDSSGIFGAAVDVNGLYVSNLCIGGARR